MQRVKAAAQPCKQVSVMPYWLLHLQNTNARAVLETARTDQLARQTIVSMLAVQKRHSFWQQLLIIVKQRGFCLALI
jgi:hypothetical protein